MTKAGFLYDLTLAVSDLPDEDKLSAVSGCEARIDELLAEGHDESEILSSFPSPAAIAGSYRRGKPVNFSVILTNGVSDENDISSVSLKNLPLFILLIPVCAAAEIILLIIGIIIAIAALALTIASALASAACFGVVTLSVGFLFIGIGGIFLTAACALLCTVLFRGIADILAIFPRRMGRLIGKGAAS